MCMCGCQTDRHETIYERNHDGVAIATVAAAFIGPIKNLLVASVVVVAGHAATHTLARYSPFRRAGARE